MEWRDEGLILGLKKHGETSVILEVMTRAHGRHLGLVKGGRSKRMQPLLQPGNQVDVVWRARLDEHLGFYMPEVTKLRAARLFANAEALHGMNLVAVLLRLIAERDPHPALYDAAQAIAETIEMTDMVPALLVRFELAILAELGFGLDLARCAATGTTDDLLYVSPKSGRAVSRAAGEAYRDRLLPLPDFLHGAWHDRILQLAEVQDGFRLTEYFLRRDLFEPRGLPMPQARHTYLSALAKRM